ncbi:aldo/keto reductase family protein [Ceratobasidium sp. AG-Ba]|nr:aldo/keto reductase family protein [Ceratobasidium sp. AG-Ba]
MRALVELVKEGKIRYIGLSLPSPTTLRRAHKVHPVAAIQVEYSPSMLDVEAKGHLLDNARERGIAVVAYTPTGAGLLSGHITCHADLPEHDFRRLSPKFSDEKFPAILALAAKFKEVGSAHNTTGSQIALAFLLAQGDNVIPIPGSKTIEYNEENMLVEYIKLTPQEAASLRKAIEETEIPGDRYPQWVTQTLFRDTPEESAV